MNTPFRYINDILSLDLLNNLLTFSIQISLVSGILWFLRKRLRNIVKPTHIIDVLSIMASLYVIRGISTQWKLLDLRHWYNLLLPSDREINGLFRIFLPAPVVPQINELSAASSIDYLYIGNIIWILGMILPAILRPNREKRRFRRLIRRNKRECPEHIQELFDELLTEYSISNKILLIWVDGLPSPCTFSRWHFTIALDRIDYTDEELRLIFRHELMHIRSNHHTFVMRLNVLRRLCWFCPVFHLLDRWFSQNIELATDAEVLRPRQTTPKERVSYARLLVSIAEETHLRGAALYLSAGSQFIRLRTEEILRPSARRWSLPVTLLILVLALHTTLLFAPGRAEYDRSELLACLGNKYTYATRGVDPLCRYSDYIYVKADGMRIQVEKTKYGSCRLHAFLEPGVDGTPEEFAAYVDGWIAEISASLGETDVRQSRLEDGEYVLKALWPVTVSEQVLKRYEADASDDFSVNLFAQFHSDDFVTLTISLVPTNNYEEKL